MNGSKRNLYNIIYMIRVREHFIYIYMNIISYDMHMSYERANHRVT